MNFISASETIKYLQINLKQIVKYRKRTEVCYWCNSDAYWYSVGGH